MAAAYSGISASVGQYNNGKTNCYNQPADVEVVVRLLNLIPAADGGRSGNRLGAAPKPAELYQAILKFQQTQNNSGAMPRLSVDGHVDPNDLTIARLNKLARRIGPINPNEIHIPSDPPLKPPKIPEIPDDYWHVPNLSLTSGSLVVGVGVGGAKGTITFEHMGGRGEVLTKNIWLAGLAAGIDTDAPFKFFESLLGKLLTGGGGGKGSWSSMTEGRCYPNPLRKTKLDAGDFTGPCYTIFLSGTVVAGGPSGYLLLFGISPLQGSPDGAGGRSRGLQCSGLALIMSVGLQAGLGASFNAYGGEIS
jgi:hypothetical protein